MWHTGVLSGRSPSILSGISSDVLSGISDWHIFWEKEKQEKKEREDEEEKTILIKSHNPHLAGGVFCRTIMSKPSMHCAFSMLELLL